MTLSGCRLAIVALLVCSTLSVGSALANTITVDNPSFETLPAGGLPFGGCGTGCFYSIASIPGWTNSGISGQFQPGTQDGDFTYFNSLSDGITNAYSNGGTISQTVSDTVELGVIYTLQVDLGFRNDVSSFVATADLLVNGATYAAIGSTPAQGNWSTFTATYTGLASDVGQMITIELNSSGQQGNFDNVRLSDNLTSVPEPTLASILGVGLAGLIAFRRRKRAC